MKKLLIFSFIFLLIIYRFFQKQPDFSDGDLVKITATVLSEPINYSDSQYIKIFGLKTYLPKYPAVNYGDNIVVRGVVKDNKLTDPELIEIIDEKKEIYDLRKKIINFYKRSLPEPHSSLVAGMVLGSKQMPESFWGKLKKTGTAHIVVASGTNVTMVASFLIGFSTFFLKRKKAIYLSLAGIFVYVVLSGFDAPIVRAAIMGSVAFLAQAFGRLVSAWKALIYSIFLMLLFKPEWLTDLGFILSVLATSGLLLFQKKLDKKLKFVPKLFREGLTTSLAAQVFVAPVIYVTFGQFNLLSPIINALVLLVVPYIMVIGGISALMGLILPKIGAIILFLAYPLTLYFTKVIELFS